MSVGAKGNDARDARGGINVGDVCTTPDTCSAQHV